MPVSLHSEVIARRRVAIMLAVALAPLRAASATPIHSRDSANDPTTSAPRDKILRVGPDREFRTLAEVVRLARDGDTIEVDAGTYRRDTAVWIQDHLTIRAVGGPVRLLADGASAEGKAIWVVRGGRIDIEGIHFEGARVPDGNGAGIRFERGHLTLRRCRFVDNEMGLLTSNDPRLTLEVDSCAFGAAPRHEGPLHHLLYVGTIGRFVIRDSQLGGGWRGHLLKSRAAVSEVRDCRLDDGPDGEASYELDFPNGGDVTLAGNLIVQSPRTQNRTLVSLGAEARDGMRGRLRMERNTLVNHAGPEARFVHVWTERLAGETEVRMADNRFVGPGQLQLPPAWDGGGNRRLPLEAWAPSR